MHAKTDNPQPLGWGFFCHITALFPSFATDFEGVSLLCRNKGHVSHASREKMKKKLGMRPIFIVSLHRQSDKTSSERRKKRVIKK
jgi:hypothetical protein